LLKEFSLNYWLDSGSLLGLIRNGILIDYDNDIDISIFSTEESKMRNISSRIIREGYRYYVLKYYGLAFKWKFIPKSSSKLRTIDINLMKTNESYFWCPQPGPITHNRLSVYVKKAAILCANAASIFFSHQKSMEEFPWSYYPLGTWWIPVNLVQPIIEFGNPGIHIPKNYEKYLEYRYGNWKVPNKHWSFWNDDGGLNKARPEELVDLPIKRRKKA